MIYKIIMVFLLSTSLLGLHPQRIEMEQPIILTLEQHIQRIFGDKAPVATAVLKHESKLKLNAKGYNCYYYNSKGKKYSKACEIKDREKAWSVDCGIAQVNVKGKTCPTKLMTLEGNMEAVEKIYKEQGLNAWVAYKTGKYKKYM